MKFYNKYLTNHFLSLKPKKTYKQRFYVWKSYLETYLPKNKKANILEIGCGMGHNLSALKKLGYENIIGIDISPESVKFCKKKGLNCYIASEDFYRKNKNKFDVVILYDFIEHFSPIEANRLLIKIKKILKKNGVLIISTPNASYPLNLKLRYIDLTHKFLYNSESISQLLLNSKFLIINIFKINSFTTYDDNLIIKFLKLFLIKPISFIGELFWFLIGITQGVLLYKCRPTLLVIAKNKFIK